MSDRIERLRSRVMRRDSSKIKARHAYTAYDQRVMELLNALPEGSAVLDVGGGRGSQYGELFPRKGVKLVVWDIDADELALNTVADHCVVVDISEPGVSESHDDRFDLILVRAGVEHFPDNQAAIENFAGVAKPGGVLLATFADGHAPFALLNRALPTTVSGFLLEKLLPASSHLVGFEAHYDRCRYRPYRDLLERSSFRINKHFCSYDSSAYFAALPPVYLLSRGLDEARRLVGRDIWPSYHLFEARLSGEQPVRT